MTRPVTSLGHQEGRRVFWEGPKFFKLCPTHFPRGGFAPCAPPGYGPGYDNEIAFAVEFSKAVFHR